MNPLMWLALGYWWLTRGKNVSGYTDWRRGSSEGYYGVRHSAGPPPGAKRTSSTVTSPGSGPVHSQGISNPEQQGYVWITTPPPGHWERQHADPDLAQQQAQGVSAALPPGTPPAGTDPTTLDPGYAQQAYGGVAYPGYDYSGANWASYGGYGGFRGGYGGYGQDAGAQDPYGETADPYGSWPYQDYGSDWSPYG